MTHWQSVDLLSCCIFFMYVAVIKFMSIYIGDPDDDGQQQARNSHGFLEAPTLNLLAVGPTTLVWPGGSTVYDMRDDISKDKV